MADPDGALWAGNHHAGVNERRFAMSADNYMAVKERNGKWHVWMVLGGYEDEDWEIPERAAGYGRGVFDDYRAAMNFAQSVCQDEVVEYGIHVLSELPLTPA